MPTVTTTKRTAKVSSIRVEEVKKRQLIGWMGSGGTITAPVIMITTFSRPAFHLRGAAMWVKGREVPTQWDKHHSSHPDLESEIDET